MWPTAVLHGKRGHMKRVDMVIRVCPCDDCPFTLGELNKFFGNGKEWYCSEGCAEQHLDPSETILVAYRSKPLLH